MVKIKYSIILLAAAALLFGGGAAYSQPDPSAQGSGEDKPQQEAVASEAAPDYTMNFAEAVNRISGAASSEEIVSVADELAGQCKTYDDYEKLTQDIKGLAQTQGFSNLDGLNYAIAKMRQSQLAFLSKTNDLESGRLFMTVNERYYAEALDSLDRALSITKSKDMALDIYFMKFQIYKEKLQAQQAEDTFNEILSAILGYSEDPAKNKAKLFSVSDKFKAMGQRDQAIKLKAAYASKTDKGTAREIFEGMRESADQSFSRGDMKDAAALYEQYTALAQSYFTKEELAPKVMEIAEKYFTAGKYKEARHYYEAYIQDFRDSKVVDYANYKLALCFYHEHDYAKSITQLENFITTYQTSIWFDKAFEVLSKLYYENFQKDKAIEGLQHLIDTYYRKNTGDYAQVLIAHLYYMDKEYDKASARLKKVDPASNYFYSAEMLTDDIKKIKKGSKPSFGIKSENSYRMWDPGKPADGEIVVKNLQKKDVLRTEEGYPKIEVKPGARIKIELGNVEDSDSYSAYMQDKDDASRLPKKLSEMTEKDILLVQWTCEGGKFSDEKQAGTKDWEAPDLPGAYKISARIDDFGLVRQPDKGLRKDPAKEMVLVVRVKE